MKKSSLIVLAILLVATLFVSCSSSPSSNPKDGYVAVITVEGVTDARYLQLNGTFYLKGADDYEGHFYKLYSDKGCKNAVTGKSAEDEYPFSISIGGTEVQDMVVFGECQTITQTPKNINLTDIKAKDKIAEFKKGDVIVSTNNDITATLTKVEFVKDASLIVNIGN